MSRLLQLESGSARALEITPRKTVAVWPVIVRRVPAMNTTWWKLLMPIRILLAFAVGSVWLFGVLVQIWRPDD